VTGVQTCALPIWLADAVASFQRYLELDPNASDRQSVEERIRRLRTRLAETGIALTVSEPGARVRIDGTLAGATPLPGPVRVAAGAHEIVVEKDGFRPFRLRVSVEGGQVVEAEATLVAIPPPRSGNRRLRRALEWVSAGVGGLALASGTVLGALAIGASDRANEERAGDADVYDDARSSAETLALGADVSFGVAFVGAATFLVLLVIDGGSAGETAAGATSAQMMPVVGPDGLRLALTGRF
jgi:hypothetical protein